MPIIGITGGIASGKSSFVSRLSRLLGDKIAGAKEEHSKDQSRKRREAFEAPALSAHVEGDAVFEQSGIQGVDNAESGEGAATRVTVFDADALARELVDTDLGVRAAIVREFGAAALTPEGVIDRIWLRESVFRDVERRKALEAILHPPIRAQWMAQVETARQTGSWLLLDIPLLYETGAEQWCDAVAVIACREETQRDRIVARRGLSAEMAGKIIASQTSLASKTARADYVVWNDAPEARLEEQAELFAGYLILWMNNLPR